VAMSRHLLGGSCRQTASSDFQFVMRVQIGGHGSHSSSPFPWARHSPLFLRRNASFLSHRTRGWQARLLMAVSLPSTPAPGTLSDVRRRPGHEAWAAGPGWCEDGPLALPRLRPVCARGRAHSGLSAGGRSGRGGSR
jgi:hypothetical protein